MPALKAQTTNTWYCEADTLDNKAVIAVFTGASTADSNSQAALKNSYGESFYHYVKTHGYKYNRSFPICNPATDTMNLEKDLSSPRVIRVNWSPVSHDLLNSDAIYWCSIVDVDNQVAYYSDLFRALHICNVISYNVEFGQYVKRLIALQVA